MDGTLVMTDLLWESLLVLLKRQPWHLLFLPLWLLGGKACFKNQVARHITLDPACLPYRQDVLEFLRREKASGREILLATASDQKLAQSVASHLGLFSAVFASDGSVNLSGRQKLACLREYLKDREFDYLGNARIDLPLWKAASEAILVSPSHRLVKQVAKINRSQRVFPVGEPHLPILVRAFRAHQWIKNLLLFVPLILAHQVTDAERLLTVFWAFCSLSVCASGAYILNDLVDLESDRRHPEKRKRPLAAGVLSIPSGLFWMGFLFALGFSLAVSLLPGLFAAVLGFYAAINGIYSLYVKRLIVVDVLVLAGLYTLRIFAGGIAADVPVSPWLLAFSVFLFLSLAFVKRYAELSRHGAEETLRNARGYRVEDREVLRTTGAASGYLSVLVLALYLNSREVAVLYRHPQVLWFVCAVILYWVTRIWLLAHRREMEDPILFTIRDPATYVVGFAIGAMLLAAV
jgi:4-hydroxybenzoate polyprenyltransferase